MYAQTPDQMYFAFISPSSLDIIKIHYLNEKKTNKKDNQIALTTSLTNKNLKIQNGENLICTSMIKSQQDQWANLSENITIHCLASNHLGIALMYYSLADV